MVCFWTFFLATVILVELFDRCQTTATVRVNNPAMHYTHERCFCPFADMQIYKDL